jgi:hypothetical protein
LILSIVHLRRFFERFLVLVNELVSVPIFILVFVTVSILPAQVAELLVFDGGDSLLAFSLLNSESFLLLYVLR